MKTRVLRYLMAALGLSVAAAVVLVLAFMRPLPVEVARPADSVPIKIFGLGTVEERILSKVGFEVAEEAQMEENVASAEAQRIAIARTLANRPRTILADEPTAALDSKRVGFVNTTASSCVSR